MRQQQPTPALQPGDYLLEYRTLGESGREEISARYYLPRGEGMAQLVPLTGNFDNSSALDCLKFWIETLPSNDFELDERTRQILVNDLLLLQSIMLASKIKPPATELPAAVNVRG